MKMKKFISILSLSVVALATSCSPFKQTSSSQRTGEGNRMEYVMNIEKDAQDYLEIVDVKLMNSESGSSESASFRVLDNSQSNTLLNLKGYESFVIVASTTNSDLQPDQAIVVYKDEPEGKSKSKKIKPLIVEAKPEE